MNLADITTKCYILALIIRDDGERLLLGDGAYEFKDSQQHFIANTYANDVVELQGTDGQMLAGQVRRTATQTFAGYIGDATFSKQKVEEARRDFLMFFRKKHYYTAVYVFSDGTAIQRDRGYIVNAPSVPELYQRFPEWSVGLNFEDPNYYEYAEDDLGHEIAAHKVELELSTAMSGGLIWDGDGAVSDDLSYVGTEIEGEGKNFQLADTGTATLKSAELLGDTEQTTYSGKNLFYFPTDTSGTSANITITCPVNSSSFTMNGTNNTGSNASKELVRNANPLTLSAGTYTIKIVGLKNNGGGLDYIYVMNASTSSVIKYVNPSNWTATFTLSESTPLSFGLIFSSTASYSNQTVTVQIESGSSATDYEPYVGGTASPNPDYPQAVNTVTGEQTVKIEGKNLVNQGQYGTGHTAGGITANFAPDAITMSGTSTSGAWPSFTMYADGSFLQQSWWPTATAIDTSKGAFNDTGDYRFTIWIDGNRGTTASNFRYIIGYMDGTVTNAYFPLDDASYSFTATKPINFISVGTANSVTVDCLVRIQLESGSSASSFEPYQAQELPVNLGKNLFTGNYAQFDNQGGTGTTYTYFKLPDDGDYNLTLIAKNAVTGTSTTYLGFTFTGGSTTNPRYWAFENGQSVTAGQKISIPNYGGGQMLHYVSLYSKSSDTLDWFMENFDIQLEKGTTATTYAPYFTPIELAKIGNYQDRIYKTGGKWYIEKQVGKVAININGYNSNYTNVDYAILDKPTDALNYGTYSVMPALCESAVSPETTGGYNQTAQIGRLCSQADKTHLWIGVTKGTTQATAKTMLDGKSVYYALATPTTTEITNNELVGQLERLQHAHTYADTTNFSITATSPNLPAFLKVVAFGDDAIPQGGYVWEDGGTGGATTITVDGVDNAQPIWTVVGPATNPSLTNITTGESIQWTGVVPNGQTLVVNMADMTASLSGANVFEFISGSWITLQAGNNRVSYSATAATGIATLEWNGVVG